MAYDTKQAEQRPVHPAADGVARSHQPPHKAREGWLVPTAVAAVAAWVIGWVAGVRWAWREVGPHHKAAKRR
ncbi:hypothetical protein [Petropleomorpha daqingensis]|uniref:Uncharacterized protein n=1 Tax=Petropleomorpha daqingensis TaxID=2026353 RepID=A0A853CLB7_9ACTN|nr:hypothetical protein [Petropleomorpha daqingensis]NYJ08864.1 hypothetical protein [Petropleomorpha daqingensis]